MHKAKVIAGIVIIVISSILLINEIRIGIIQEMSYQRCQQMAGTVGATIICHHFIDHIRALLYYSIVISIGVWVLVFGLKSISLKSFSRK